MTRRRLAELAVYLGLGAAAAILLAGLFAPRDYRAVREADFDAPPAALYALIQDVEARPRRRADILRVSAVERDATGPLRWREDVALGGWLLYESEARTPLRRFKVRLLASSMGFSGTWDYVLQELPGGRCRLSLAEQSRADSFFPRALLALGGRAGNLKAEIRALQSALKKPA